MSAILERAACGGGVSCSTLKFHAKFEESSLSLKYKYRDQIRKQSSPRMTYGMISEGMHMKSEFITFL